MPKKLQTTHTSQSSTIVDTEIDWSDLEKNLEDNEKTLVTHTKTKGSKNSQKGKKAKGSKTKQTKKGEDALDIKNVDIDPLNDNLLPQMKESIIVKLQELLESNEPDSVKLSLHKCITKMTVHREQHILFLRYFREAIIHSLLERQWDNLVELLMMLVDNFFCPIFTNFLREMCEIIHTLDPRVVGTELGDQLELIKKVYESKRDTTKNIV